MSIKIILLALKEITISSDTFNNKPKSHKWLISTSIIYLLGFTNPVFSIVIGGNTGVSFIENYGIWNLDTNWSTGEIPTLLNDVSISDKWVIVDENPNGIYDANASLLWLSGDGSISLVNTSLYATMFQFFGGRFVQYGDDSLVEIAASFYLGEYDKDQALYTLDGGQLSVGLDMEIARLNNTNGVFLHKDGSSIISDNLILGNGNNALGSYDLKVGKLDVGKSTYLGVDGSGIFTQSGGFHSIAENLYLGKNDGSSGSYTLSGGELAIHGDIIGGTGSSELNIDGGQLTMPVSSSIDVDTFRVGYKSGKTGSFSLSSNQSLTVVSEIIGDNGTGTLNIEGGSNTISETLTLGNEAGSIGEINFTSGSVSAQSLIIGNAGTGSFTQNGGSNTVSGEITLGKEATGEGSYLLNSGTVSANLIKIGDQGKGEFTQTGGSVDGRVLLAYAKDSQGTYNLKGGDLATIGTQVIGRKGSAEFLQTGGTNTAKSLLIGKYADGNGTYKLTGGTLNVDDIVVAKAGTGKFVQNNNDILEISSLILGQSSGSDGSYRLRSGTLNNSGDTLIGDAGIGSFVHKVGNHSANSVVIGNSATAEGSYSLQSGALDVATDLVVGSYGQGDFEQSGGTATIAGSLVLGDFTTNSQGSYTMSGGDLIAKNAVIGNRGVGIFNQTGGNIALQGTSSGILTLGNSNSNSNSSGSGTFNLSNGSLDVEMIDSDYSEGTFNYSGGSLNIRNGWIKVDNFTIGQTLGSDVTYTHELNNFIADNLVVGGFGKGELIVTGAFYGAELITSTTKIGSGSFGDGSIKFQGGAWTNSGDLSMGGTFGGKSFLSLDSNSDVNIKGDINVSNKGSVEIANSHLKASNLNLSGRLKLAENSTLDISNQIALSSSGSIDIQANTVQEITADLIHNGSEIRINAGAELVLGGAVSGTGAYTGLGKTVINNTFNPGNSPGLVTFEGDLTLGDGSHTTMEVTGLLFGDEYDAVQVGGTLSLNGLLDISLSDFTPDADYSFDLFSAETITGIFDEVNFLTSGLVSSHSPWSLDYVYNVEGLDYLRLDYDNVILNAVPTSPVPEPSVLALMGLGLLILLGINRRKFKLDALKA